MALLPSNIGGLIIENARDFVCGLIGLGAIPVLGHLSRSQKVVNGGVELTILIALYQAKPVDARSARLAIPRVAARMSTGSARPRGAVCAFRCRSVAALAREVLAMAVGRRVGRNGAPPSPPLVKQVHRIRRGDGN
jgi:Flp pilus assembly secretin CpaC